MNFAFKKKDILSGENYYNDATYWLLPESNAHEEQKPVVNGHDTNSSFELSGTVRNSSIDVPALPD